MLEFVTVDTPQQFGTGDGITTQFQLLDGSTPVSVPVQENIYRTDWQGRQLLYATPRTNLLQQSSNFASWGNFGGAPTGSVTGPDGVSTAEVFVESTDNTNHFTDRADAVIVSGSTNTLSVLAAQAGRRYLQLGLDDGAGLNGIYATFDLQAGVVTQALTLGAGVVVDTNIAKLPAAGWYQVSVSGSCAEVTAVRTFFLLSELSTAGVAPGYTGDGVSGIAMFDAQLEPGSVATSRIPTTTAPVTVTDYVLLPGGTVSLSEAPLKGAILDWTGKYSASVADTFPGLPLQSVVPAYLYQQYADDADLQSFFSGFNATSQGYVDWFNQTPLSVYTNASINGPLLDWIGQGLYGISRPVVSTLTSTTAGEVNGAAINTLAINRHFIRRSGTVSVASDDIYKRVLTWHAYIGDGRQMSAQWLRRRVARFIYGADGSDIPVDYLSLISINQPILPSVGAPPAVPINTTAIDVRKPRNQRALHAIQITVPNNAIGQTFQVLMREGYLALPFQVRFTVTLAS